MGYNATVVVMVDALHEIENDPQFGKKLAAAIRAIGTGAHKTTHIDVSAGCHCNAATVIESHHADFYETVLVGGNTGQNLGYSGSWRVDLRTHEGIREALKSLVTLHGYTLHKKPGTSVKGEGCG